jgi:hypothetical protein
VINAEFSQRRIKQLTDGAAHVSLLCGRRTVSGKFYSRCPVSVIKGRQRIPMV